jgi:hypothetical protein
MMSLQKIYNHLEESKYIVLFGVCDIDLNGRKSLSSIHLSRHMQRRCICSQIDRMRNKTGEMGGPGESARAAVHIGSCFAAYVQRAEE